MLWKLLHLCLSCSPRSGFWCGSSLGPALGKEVLSMPIYAYQCRQCGHSFELLRRIKDTDSDVECPKCHSLKVERHLSTFAAGSCGGSPSGGFT